MRSPTVPAAPPAGLPKPLADLRRTVVMGVLNVTPDSFSDGGRYLDLDAAVRHALELAESGADIIDIGGESTRPGAQPVSAAGEQQRVLPVIADVAGRGIPVSIDTMHAATAVAAVEAGACMVNDVSGGLADPGMIPALAPLAVPYVVMHWRGPSGAATHYADVVGEVAAHLRDRVECAAAAGIARDRIVADPGLGFAKDHHHNWSLLAALDRIAPAGVPVLVGASRKRFLGALLADPAGRPRPVADRDTATAAVTTLAAAAGAWCVRVHDAAGSADAVKVVAAWQERGGALDAERGVAR